MDANGVPMTKGNIPTFGEWWDRVASAPPKQGEDHEEHLRRVALDAFNFGFMVGEIRGRCAGIPE